MPVSETDGLAMVLLMQFIEKGIPSTDPKTQIATAYMYASLIEQYKSILVEETEKALQEQIPIVCPKCKAELKRMDTGTIARPGTFELFCITENCGYKFNPF